MVTVTRESVVVVNMVPAEEALETDEKTYREEK